MGKLVKASIPLVAASFIAFFIVLLVTRSEPAWFPLALIPILLAATLLGIKGGIASALIAMALVSLMITKEQGLPWPSHYIPRLIIGFLVYMLSGLFAGLWSTIERRRAEEERKRRQLAETLREVSEVVTSSLEVKEALDLILDQLGKVVDYDSACIMLLFDDTFKVVAGRGFPDIEQTLQLSFPLAEDALSQHIFKTKRPLVLADAQKDERYLRAGGTDWVHAWMGIPLIVKGEVIGLLTIDNKQPGVYNQETAQTALAFANQVAIAIENARLYEETRRRAERLAVINRISRAAGTTLHLDTLVEVVYQEISHVFQADAFFLALYDSETNELDFRLRVDEGIREPPERRPMEAGLTATVVTTKKPLLIRDFEKEKDRLPPVKVWGTMKIPPSWLGMPMLIGDQVVGVISVQAYHPHAYGEEEQQLLSTIADQVAVAVENARLYEETRRRAEEMTALHETTLDITAQLEMKRLLDAIIQRASDLLGATGGLVHLYDPAKKRLVAVTCHNLERDYTGLTLEVGEGVAGKVFQTGEPLIIEDHRTWAGKSPQVGDAYARSVIGVPLRWRGQVIGVLDIMDNVRAGAFGKRDLQLLMLFADQAAIAIENARLYEAEQERRDLAESLAEATAALTATLDFDQVLDRILEQVSRVVPNDAANIMLIEGDQVRIARWRGYERFGTEEFVSTVVFRIPEVANLRQMVESKEPMVIADTATYPGWVRVPVTEWLRSYAAAPIIVRGEVIGFLNVDSATPGFFTQAHAEALRAFADHAAAAIENARLYEAEQRRWQDAEALRQTALALTSALDRNQVIERILSQLQQVVPYDSASVQLLQGDKLVIIGGRGFPNLEELLGISFPVDGDNPNREVMRTLSPFILDDAPAVYEAFTQEPFAAMGIRSWLGVPMLIGKRPVGMITLDKCQPGFYTQEHARLAQAFAAQAAIAIENARLFEEERRRAAQLAVVNKVGRHATSTLELDQILRDVTTAIQIGFGYYNVATFLVEGEYAVLKAIAGGFAEAVKDGYRQHLSQGIVGWCITHDQTMLANDVSRDPHFVPGFLEKVVTQSELCVPIRVDGKVVGALDVQSTELNAFDEWDVRALETLSDQVALAYKNALAYGHLDEEKGRLELLYEVAAEVNRSLDLDEILARAIERITARLGGKVGYVFLVEPGTDRLQLRALSGVDVPISELNEMLDVHLGQGVVGWVAAHREAAVVDDVTQDERWLYVDELDRGIRSVMSVPLVRGEETLGALSVLHSTPGFFDEEQCRLLMAVAQQVAVAVANARLHQTVQEQAMLDSLTQVYNHGELIRRLHMAVEEGARENQPVSYIMLDIDYFKEYNDRYGHVTGDLILKAIVQAIQANIKKTDIVGRWGGEEFGIVLPRTDREQAQIVAQRIRHTLATMSLTDGKGHEVPKPTVSQGIATYPTTTSSAEELIDLADAALYRAKARGRDQVDVVCK